MPRWPTTAPATRRTSRRFRWWVKAWPPRSPWDELQARWSARSPPVVSSERSLRRERASPMFMRRALTLLAGLTLAAGALYLLAQTGAVTEDFQGFAVGS